ncbi:MAG: YihY/virulence factor BrkB family protein [Chloroflexi bacterium]|nr:YihY/virulence factor BrkB family protein [Chloroflexota bacterium]
MSRLRLFGGFLQKLGGDWIFGLASLLAYNFLTAIFPLFLGILALVALAAPSSVTRQVAGLLGSMLPLEVTSKEGLNLDLYSILTGFQKSSAITATISLLGFLWTGSNLFSAMESCFNIIFRVRGRNPIRQKIMSLTMVLLFAFLAPIAVISSTLSSSIPHFIHIFSLLPYHPILFRLLSFGFSIAIVWLMFSVIYYFVPNREMHIRQVWPGALVSAMLFVAINASFPLYLSHFVIHAWFGRIMLVLGILALWFWVISVILIIGAQINAVFVLGERPLGVDIAGAVCILAEHYSLEDRAGGDFLSKKENVVNTDGEERSPLPKMR